MPDWRMIMMKVEWTDRILLCLLAWLGACPLNIDALTAHASGVVSGVPAGAAVVRRMVDVQVGATARAPRRHVRLASLVISDGYHLLR